MIRGSYHGKCPPQGRYLFWTHCNSDRTRIPPKTLCLHFSLLCQVITPPLLAAGDLEGAWHYITRTLKCAYFSQICTTTKILIKLEMLKKVTWILEKRHNHKQNYTNIHIYLTFCYLFLFLNLLSQHLDHVSIIHLYLLVVILDSYTHAFVRERCITPSRSQPLLPCPRALQRIAGRV